MESTTVVRGAVNGQRIVPPSEGFEWWYLHIGARKFSATIVIHTTAFLGGPVAHPYMSVTIARIGKRVIDDHIPFDRRELNWSSGYLTVANHVIEHRDGWDLNLRGPDWILEGAICRESNGWRVKDSKLIANSDGDEMHWSVPMPRGRWRGSLTINGETLIDKSGYAYQDHNWADVCLANFVNGWQWRTLANEKSTVIWAEVGSADGETEQFGIQVDRDGRFTPRRKAPRVILKDRTVVKCRKYRRDLERASYERAIIRRKLPINAILGFSEDVRVMADISADGDSQVTRDLTCSVIGPVNVGN